MALNHQNQFIKVGVKKLQQLITLDHSSNAGTCLLSACKISIFSHSIPLSKMCLIIILGLISFM